MAEHEHGSMDITEQERTFAGFLKVTAVTIVISLLALIFLAIFRT